MNDSEFADLLNKYLDGEMRPEEIEEFEQLIAQNQEQQQKYLAVQMMTDHAKKAPLFDPPANIEENVIRLIARKNKDSKVSHIIFKLNEYIDGVIRPRRNVAFAFVSGLIFGCIIIAAWSNLETSDSTTITGAIGTNVQAISQSVNLPLAGLHAKVEMQATATDISCKIQINGQHPYELVLMSDTTPISIQDYNVESIKPVFINTDAQKIIISGQADAALFFNLQSAVELPNSVQISLNSHGKEIYRDIVFD
jgi:hypothetical protein